METLWVVFRQGSTVLTYPINSLSFCIYNFNPVTDFIEFKSRIYGMKLYFEVLNFNGSVN